MEFYIKEMKAVYFDLMEAGGPPELKMLITKLMKDYETAPFYDRLPDEAAMEVCATSESAVADTDVNHLRMKNTGAGPREQLEPYVSVPSTLSFARGDLIRTPIMNKRKQMWPAWFYVNEVIQTPAGVNLRGWRLGEYDQKARHKYRDQRTIMPDQYTFIERRDTTRMDHGLENY